MAILTITEAPEPPAYFIPINTIDLAFAEELTSQTFYLSELPEENNFEVDLPEILDDYPEDVSISVTGDFAGIDGKKLRFQNVEAEGDIEVTVTLSNQDGESAEYKVTYSFVYPALEEEGAEDGTELSEVDGLESAESSTTSASKISSSSTSATEEVEK